MFLLHEYDIFWAFLIISSVIPILAFFISGVLAPISEGPEKLSSYESGIAPPCLLPAGLQGAQVPEV